MLYDYFGLTEGLEANHTAESHASYTQVPQVHWVDWELDLD